MVKMGAEYFTHTVSDCNFKVRYFFFTAFEYFFLISYLYSATIKLYFLHHGNYLKVNILKTEIYKFKMRSKR